MRAAFKWTAGFVLVVLVALALFVLFGLNALRGPISRAVGEATGRELVIEGDLKPVWDPVHLGFRAEGVRFANPGWAQSRELFTARAVELRLELLPLLRGRVVLPAVRLEQPVVNLERDADGRRSWAIGEDDGQGESRVTIRRLSLDRGKLRYVDAARKIGVDAALTSDATGIAFTADGKYRGEGFTAKGHTGPVLSLRDASEPFPVKAQISVGETKARVDGTIGNIVGLQGFDAAVELSGESLSHLYRIVNVAFPHTPPYRTSGRLVRDGDVVRYENFTGKVGESDIAGTLQVDLAAERPFMRGELHSKLMNLADLGVLVGTDQPRKQGVLPDAPFDPSRWDSVDADVRIRAGTLKRPRQLPLENLAARVRMQDRRLTLAPLEFGVAGGKLAGTVALDGRREPIRADVKMRVQHLRLAELFPTLERNRTSVGDIGGLVELSGSGNSVGRMLGTADGKIGLFLDGGSISRFMMELVALDLWDMAKIKLTGDENIAIRCAIADFAVQDGLMKTNAFVVDTSAVLVEGGGVVNLKDEQMNLKLQPKPKDSSIASLNSPLYVSGSFARPRVSPDVGSLAAKGLGAIVMGVVNPLLAVLPLFKEGDPEKSNCGRLIAQASRAGKP